MEIESPKLFNDPSIIKSTAHINLNEGNITNAWSIQVNQWPQFDSHVAVELYVGWSVEESSLLRLDPDENLKLDEQNSIFLNSFSTLPKTKIEIPKKAYFDSLHDENERNRKDLGLAFHDEEVVLVKDNQDNNFNDNKLSNIDTITINRKPTSNIQLTSKNYVDDLIEECTIVRFNQTLSNYLKVSVGNDTYDLTKSNKIQLTDTTIIKTFNSGGYCLQSWNIKCIDKNGAGKFQYFVRSTKINGQTGDSVALNLPRIGDIFMYIETITNNHGKNVFVSW